MNEIINFGEKKKVKIIMLKGEKGDAGNAGDYSGLTNKPQINDVELSGNKTASDLGIVSETEFEQFENATNTSITKIQDSVATIETTSTSAHGYSKGAYLVFNGYLYKALSDISVGDTLDDTEGTGNIGRVRIGGEIYNTKSSVSELQTDVSGLQADMETAQGNIAQLITDISTKISSSNIQQMGFIRVNQATGIHPINAIVGTWTKIGNTNNVYIDYTVNYYNTTHNLDDTMRLDGFPQTTFRAYTATTTRSYNGVASMSASGNSIPSTNYPNNSSDSLSLLGFTGTSTGDSMRFSGIVYAN